MKMKTIKYMMNDYQLKLLNESNKLIDYKKFINEAQHYHKFLESTLERLFYMVERLIKIASKNNGHIEEKVELNTEMVNKIRMIINLKPVKTFDEIKNKTIYKATYYNEHERLNKYNQLETPTITLTIPYIYEKNDFSEGILRTLLSHELTHLYDDWMSLKHSGFSIMQTKSITPEDISHESNQLLQNIKKIVYFSSKSEQKAFTQMTYEEFKYVGLNYDNFRQTIKKTTSYSNYRKLLDETIPYIENTPSIKIVKVINDNIEKLKNLGLPIYDKQKDSSREKYKERLISWAKYQVNLFMKRFGGVMMQYLENYIKENKIYEHGSFYIMEGTTKKNKTIIINETQLQLIENIVRADVEEVTYYQFLSELKHFLRQLMSNPVSCQLNDFFKLRGYTKGKLCKYMEKVGLIEKEEKVNGTSMDVKYSIPRDKFTRKTRRMYQTLFEKDKVNECGDMLEHMMGLDEEFDDVLTKRGDTFQRYNKFDGVSTIQDDIDDFAERYNLQQLTLYNMGNGYVALEDLAVKERGKGYGTKIMNELTKWADKNNITILLTPAATGSLYGFDVEDGEPARIENFYKKFGFTKRELDDYGERKNDQHPSGHRMVRTPQQENIEPQINTNFSMIRRPIYKPILDEAMVGLDQLNNFVIIYNRNDNMFLLYNTLENKPYGYISFGEIRSENVFSIFGAYTKRGYGPILYESVMTYVYPMGITMSADGSTSDDALNVWNKFKNRNDVTKKPIKWDSAQEKHIQFDTMQDMGFDNVENMRELFNTQFIYSFGKDKLNALISGGDDFIENNPEFMKNKFWPLVYYLEK